MKTFIYILACLLFVITSCSEKKVKQIPLIEGHISNYNGNKVFLFEDGAADVALDTADVDSEGVFSVSKQSIKTIGFFYLQFQDGGKINFFLKPTDYVYLQVDANNLLESCKSNNSKLLMSYWELEKINHEFNSKLKKLSEEFSYMEGQALNDSLYQNLYRRKDILIKDLRNKSLRIAKEANSPIIDFLMLNQKAGNNSLFSLESDLQLFVDNAEQLTSDEQLKKLFAEYDKKIMQTYALIRAEGHYHKGNKFPELRARTNWNEIVTLKDMNGKPTHIIFWSGHDLMDDAKLKQTKSMMYRYGSQGLKTVMVAYTKNKKNWLAHIKKHRLPYWHLIDTMSVHSLDLVETGVRSLPCNFVVDSAGTIINRDIWGDELELTIRSNIKK
ncbi:TlpA family protein disulfide reductase [Saccharicrinis sp. 156]|uniref:TlpA family protein disulfide reductase n=1 Tax=Saccharicrinis sp. 156 TaxID=3417574 RepID=UPI003D335997